MTSQRLLARKFMHRFVGIERDSASYASWSSLIHKQSIQGLSVQEIVNKYQGFEGELIFFFEIIPFVNEETTWEKFDLTYDAEHEFFKR